MKIIRYIPVLAVGLLFVACSSDDNIVEATKPVITETGSELQPMRISAAVSGQTRAAGTTWAMGDTIGITMIYSNLDKGEPEYGCYVNEAYIYQKVNNAAGEEVDSFICPERAFTVSITSYHGRIVYDTIWTSNIMYYNDHEWYNVRPYVGYYPYISGNYEYLPRQVEKDTYDQSPTAQAHYDFMYAPETENVGANLILTFQHKMSMISLNFVDVDGRGVHVDSLRLGGLILAGTFSPRTGVATASNWSSELRKYTTMYWLKPETNQSRVELIFFPQSSYTPDFDNLIVYNNGILYKAKLNIPKLEAGNDYYYTVTLDRSAIVSQATIKAWGNGVSKAYTIK
jgi:hypothetical protein